MKVCGGSPPRGRGRPWLPTLPGPAVGLAPALAGTAAGPRDGEGTSEAHPRAGGDGVGVDISAPPVLGSPPRGRRRPRDHHGDGAPGGLTPARAGTAHLRHLPYPQRRAHPRAGGDGPTNTALLACWRGSPPRGRGRPGERVARRTVPGLTPRGRGRLFGGHGAGAVVGLTPARAGTALIGDRRRGLTPARAGTAGPLAEYFTKARAHPARAGTAAPHAGTTGSGRAHPRAGGDGSTVATTGRYWPGSPPRGRGRPADRHRPRAVRGLTPARAGTARGRRARSPRRRAHPRAGGDGVGREIVEAIRAGGDGRETPCQLIGTEGSPPRGRGRRTFPLGRFGPPGLTPARAGTAQTTRSTTGSGRAHPRAGGDGTIVASLGWLGRGSPPRRRGRP